MAFRNGVPISTPWTRNHARRARSLFRNANGWLPRKAQRRWPNMRRMRSPRARTWHGCVRCAWRKNPKVPRPQERRSPASRANKRSAGDKRNLEIAEHAMPLWRRLRAHGRCDGSARRSHLPWCRKEVTCRNPQIVFLMSSAGESFWRSFAVSLSGRSPCERPHRGIRHPAWLGDRKMSPRAGATRPAPPSDGERCAIAAPAKHGRSERRGVTPRLRG